MTDMTSCPRIRQLLGVYVVGAIDPAERAEVDRHLAGCPDCREELAGLAGLPALLGRIPVEEAGQLAGVPSGQTGFFSERSGPGARPDAALSGDEMLAPLLARAARRRRAGRWRSLAAAAAVALIAAGTTIGAVRLGTGTSPAAHWEQARAATPAGLTADIRYAPAPWGTRVDAQVSGIKAGTTCQFWVLDGHGGRWQAGSWTVASGYPSESFPESVALPASAVHGFQVTSGSRVLLTIPAA